MLILPAEVPCASRMPLTWRAAVLFIVRFAPAAIVTVTPGSIVVMPAIVTLPSQVVFAAILPLIPPPPAGARARARAGARPATVAIVASAVGAVADHATDQGEGQDKGQALSSWLRT